VIDDSTRELLASFPPMIYLPCVRHVTDPADIEVAYRETKDGRVAVLVYSALDRLKTCCGDEQPWFVLPSLYLETMYEVRPFDLVLLDVVIPDHERQHAVS
jgi:hypothetical protein